MITDLLIRYLGYGIGFGVPGLILAFRRGHWERSAHRLARRADIALPLWMEDRVVGFLRAQYLFGMAVTCLLVPLEVTVLTAPAIAGGSAVPGRGRLP